MIIFQNRESLLAGYPAPVGAVAHGVGSDVEQDLPLLWALLHAQRPGPRVIVELGTRTGLTTRTLALAAQALGAVFITVDPDAACRPHIRGVKAVFFQDTGESIFHSRIVPQVDVLFVDTDPHSYAQTQKWCDTWVAHRVREDGLTIFHDTLARDIDGTPRLDIQVAPAVRDWARVHGYRWTEYDGTSGLGVLVSGTGTPEDAFASARQAS